MEKNLNHIDNLFKEGLSDYAETPPPSVWDALEERLDKDDNKKGGFIYRRRWVLLALAFLSMLSSLMAWRFSNGTLAFNANSNKPESNSPAEAHTASTNEAASLPVAGATATQNNDTPQSGSKTNRHHHTAAIEDATVNNTTDNNTASNNSAVAKDAATSQQATTQVAANQPSPTAAPTRNDAQYAVASSNETPDNGNSTKKQTIKYILKNTVKNNIVVAETEAVVVNENTLNTTNDQDDEDETTFGKPGGAKHTAPVKPTNHYAANTNNIPAEKIAAVTPSSTVRGNAGVSKTSGKTAKSVVGNNPGSPSSPVEVAKKSGSTSKPATATNIAATDRAIAANSKTDKSATTGTKTTIAATTPTGIANVATGTPATSNNKKLIASVTKSNNETPNAKSASAEKRHSKKAPSAANTSSTAATTKSNTSLATTAANNLASDPAIANDATTAKSSKIHNTSTAAKTKDGGNSNASNTPANNSGIAAQNSGNSATAMAMVTKTPKKANRKHVASNAVKEGKLTNTIPASNTLAAGTGQPATAVTATSIAKVSHHHTSVATAKPAATYATKTSFAQVAPSATAAETTRTASIKKTKHTSAKTSGITPTKGQLASLTSASSSTPTKAKKAARGEVASSITHPVASAAQHTSASHNAKVTATNAIASATAPSEKAAHSVKKKAHTTTTGVSALATTPPIKKGAATAISSKTTKVGNDSGEGEAETEVASATPLANKEQALNNGTTIKGAKIYKIKANEVWKQF